MGESIFYLNGTDGKATDPQTISDLGLDRIFGAAESVYSLPDIRGYFLCTTNSADEIRFRSGVYRDIEEPGIRRLLENFLTDYASMRTCLDNMAVQSHIPGKHKWFLDAMAHFCEGVDKLKRGLDTVQYKSVGLQRLHNFLGEYASSDEYTALKADLTACAGYLAGVRYTISLDTERYCIRVARAGEANTLSNILGEKLEKYGCESLHAGISALQGIQLRELELGILDDVVTLYPELPGHLSAFFSAYGSFRDIHFGQLICEINFYRSYIDFCKKLKWRGHAMSFAEVRGEGGINLSNLYDLALACDTPEGVVCSYDISPDSSKSIHLITGGSRSGKTTLLRALGQAIYLSHLGLPAPCSGGYVELNSAVLTHFAEDEAVGSNYGRLKEELVRIRDMFDTMPERSTLLFNDIFESTTTLDAVKISREILGMVQQKSCRCFFVTHIDELSREIPGADTIETKVTVSAGRTVYGIQSSASSGDSATVDDGLLGEYALTYGDIVRRLA